MSHNFPCDGLPSEKRLGEMTPEERDTAFAAAAKRLGEWLSDPRIKAEFATILVISEGEIDGD